MLPEQRIDGSAQVLRVSHGTYQVVECVGFGGVLATTPDHREGHQTGSSSTMGLILNLRSLWGERRSFCYRYEHGSRLP